MVPRWYLSRLLAFTLKRNLYLSHYFFLYALKSSNGSKRLVAVDVRKARFCQFPFLFFDQITAPDNQRANNTNDSTHAPIGYRGNIIRCFIFYHIFFFFQLGTKNCKKNTRSHSQRSVTGVNILYPSCEAQVLKKSEIMGGSGVKTRTQ